MNAGDQGGRAGNKEICLPRPANSETVSSETTNDDDNDDDNDDNGDGNMPVTVQMT